MSKKKKPGNNLGNTIGDAPTPAHKDEIDNYEVEGHLRTLMDAEKIKQDPEKMKRVHKLAGRHSKAISSIRDLKSTYDDKFGMGALRKKDEE